MKRTKDHVQLTLKEAEEIMQLLYTLGSMGGTADEEDNPDPEFNKDCNKARRKADKIWNLL